MNKETLWRGRIPIWRLMLWAFVAMAGVAYFAQPETEGQRHFLWGFVVLVGVVLFGAGMVLNRIATDRERAQVWVCKHGGLICLVLVIAFLSTILLKLWSTLLHK